MIILSDPSDRLNHLNDKAGLRIFPRHDLPKMLVNKWNPRFSVSASL